MLGRPPPPPPPHGRSGTPALNPPSRHGGQGGGRGGWENGLPCPPPPHRAIFFRPGGRGRAPPLPPLVRNPCRLAFSYRQGQGTARMGANTRVWTLTVDRDPCASDWTDLVRGPGTVLRSHRVVPVGLGSGTLAPMGAPCAEPPATPAPPAGVSALSWTTAADSAGASIAAKMEITSKRGC